MPMSVPDKSLARFAPPRNISKKRIRFLRASVYSSVVAKFKTKDKDRVRLLVEELLLNPLLKTNAPKAEQCSHIYQRVHGGKYKEPLSLSIRYLNVVIGALLKV
jgi:hypothetical protein